MSTGTDAILVGAPLTATGGVLFADTDATLPTNAATAVDEAFVAGGYVGEDGVTRTVDATDEKIKAWGGDTVKIVRTEHSITYTFQFMEAANAEVLKLIHGEDNVVVVPAVPGTTSGTVTVKHTAKLPPRKAFVLDMVDGDALMREVIMDGQLTTSGDVVFVHSDVIRYSITIEAFPDAQGVKAISYMDDGTGA